MALEVNTDHRQYSDCFDHGGRKRRNCDEVREPYDPGYDATVYRYLCQDRRMGRIIGRGGEIAKKLRSDTEANIVMNRSTPSCHERVITIFSTSQETNSVEGLDEKICPAQDALFKVHESLSDDDASTIEVSGSYQVKVRLLVPSDQVKCLIGKGGQNIRGMRNETGAKILIFNENLPACALPGDELVQISGDASIVRKALFQVSSLLHNKPSRSRHMLISEASQIYRSGQDSGILTGDAPIEERAYRRDGGYKVEQMKDAQQPCSPPFSEDTLVKEFSLRVLCPSGKICDVIGKGGTTIKQIREESRASITLDTSAEEEDCIITVSAKELFDDPISPTVDAAVLLQPLCSEKTDPESGELLYTTRLLVPSSCIGGLIGRGGGIIKEIRRSSRAQILLISKGNLPKVASDEDGMIQISGAVDVTKNALIQIITQLKSLFLGRGSVVHPSPCRPLHGNYYHGSTYSNRSDDVLLSYGSHGGFQGGQSRYRTYENYFDRPGSSWSDDKHASYGKHNWH